MKILESKCISCGQCEEFCPVEAIKPKKGSGYSTYYIDKNLCIDCEICIKVCDCPGEAMRREYHERKDT